jgi:DNA processing protein
MDSIIHWICLSNIEGLGVKYCLNLINIFGGASNVYNQSFDTLKKVGMTIEQYKSLHDSTVIEKAKEINDICNNKDIKIITLEHDEYPELLKYIYNPPLILYARGNIPKSNPVAVVGSRNASGYGMETASRISKDLAQAGITIVSGMARGIDTSAHCGALKAKGKTVAVLGCGVDIVYPPENRNLMNRIIESGAVISEYPPGTRPLYYHFPSRNRIISGMSLGTLIVEAGMKSGSLITANYALDQGREVFAVPGDITHYNSMGTNRLIKDGAKMVLCAQDVLEELNFGLEPLKIINKNNALPELCIEAKKIINALRIEDLYDEELSLKTGIPIKDLFGLLLDLEIKGMIAKSLSGKYRLTEFRGIL